MRGAWETVRGRMAKREREKETASQHQKAILGDQGEHNHISMMPGRDTRICGVFNPLLSSLTTHSHPHYNLLFVGHTQEGEVILETETFFEIHLSCSVINFS